MLLPPTDIHLQHDAAVLRQALLADIQLCHNLDARSDGIFQLQRRRHDGLEHAINTEPHPKFLLVGLHVDVASPPLYSIGQDQVHQLDDGRLVGSFLQFREVHLLFFALQFDVGIADLRHRLHDLL